MCYISKGTSGIFSPTGSFIIITFMDCSIPNSQQNCGGEYPCILQEVKIRLPAATFGNRRNRRQSFSDPALMFGGEESSTVTRRHSISGISQMNGQQRSGVGDGQGDLTIPVINSPAGFHGVLQQVPQQRGQLPVRQRQDGGATMRVRNRMLCISAR